VPDGVGGGVERIAGVDDRRQLTGSAQVGQPVENLRAGLRERRQDAQAGGAAVELGAHEQTERTDDASLAGHPAAGEHDRAAGPQDPVQAA
jgi:hypothetical protein